MRELIEQLFPHLHDTTFEITSPRDRRYNCVAWATGDTRRWWWPGEVPFSFWLVGVEREESVANFIGAFATLGYEAVASGDHDPLYEKVAIFASVEGVPTHMARQLPNGSWTSKLGALEDIAHVENAARTRSPKAARPPRGAGRVNGRHGMSGTRQIRTEA